jgi:hypothetical protein
VPLIEEKDGRVTLLPEHVHLLVLVADAGTAFDYAREMEERMKTAQHPVRRIAPFEVDVGGCCTISYLPVTMDLDRATFSRKITHVACMVPLDPALSAFVAQLAFKGAKSFEALDALMADKPLIPARRS